MDMVEKAIIFAAKAHGNQKRKGTDIPYITHPFAVGMLLQKEKCSEEVIAAGSYTIHWKTRKPLSRI